MNVVLFELSEEKKNRNDEPYRFATFKPVTGGAEIKVIVSGDNALEPEDVGSNYDIVTIKKGQYTNLKSLEKLESAVAVAELPKKTATTSTAKTFVNKAELPPAPAGDTREANRASAEESFIKDFASARLVLSKVGLKVDDLPESTLIELATSIGQRITAITIDANKRK